MTKEDNENNKRISRGGGKMREQMTCAKSNEIVEAEDNTAC